MKYLSVLVLALVVFTGCGESVADKIARAEAEYKLAEKNVELAESMIGNSENIIKSALDTGDRDEVDKWTAALAEDQDRLESARERLNQASKRLADLAND